MIIKFWLFRVHAAPKNTSGWSHQKQFKDNLVKREELFLDRFHFFSRGTSRKFFETSRENLFTSDLRKSHHDGILSCPREGVLKRDRPFLMKARTSSSTKKAGMTALGAKGGHGRNFHYFSEKSVVDVHDWSSGGLTEERPLCARFPNPEHPML